MNIIFCMSYHHRLAKKIYVSITRFIGGTLLLIWPNSAQQSSMIPLHRVNFLIHLMQTLAGNQNIKEENYLEAYSGSFNQADPLHIPIRFYKSNYFKT